jgi:hypothetical protein
MTSIRGQSNATGGGDIPVLVDAATGSLLVKSANDTTQASEIGSLTETAPATDTASSGLNGRLQRVAQRVTSLIALLPASLGTKTAANSLPVTLSSDGVFAVSSGTTTDALATDSSSAWSNIALLKGILQKLLTPTPTGHGANVTITRPATTPTYSAGQLIGDVGGSAIFTFANMGKAGGEVMITSIELEIDVAAVNSGMTGFNVRLYNASPTAAADAATWDIVSGDRGKYLGKVALATPIDEGSTLFGDNDGINKQITLASTSLFVEMQTVGSYAATASAVYRLTIHTTEI